MNQEILERILNCPTLPSLPAVAVRVLELTQHNNVPIDQLAETIQNDQGLAAKVLKTVNSSFFGLRRPCTTINQAIVMLGLSAVKSLALSFSLVSALHPQSSCEFDYLSYWRRGLYTAVAAKCIAHETGLPTEDEAFLGGLLQDVGMVAMFKGLGRRYLEVMLRADGDHRSLVRHELHDFELQHPDVGAMLCERWKLPPELILPVRFHERPTAAPEQYASLVRCVGLGNIAHDVLTDAEPADAFKKFQDRAKQWFELAASDCNTLIRRIAEGTKQVSSLFRLNTGEAADAEAIVSRAQEQLENLKLQAPEPTAHGANLSSLVSDGDEIDALTGVMTSAAWSQQVESAFAAARAGRKSLSIVVARIDAFEELVARLGSDAGDIAIVETGTFLLDQAQPIGGAVGRVDSAVFGLQLPGVDRVEAVRMGTEIRSAIQAASRKWGIPGSSGLTVSVGVATMEGRDLAFVKASQLVSAGVRACEVAVSHGGNSVRSFVPKIAA